jgi:hypothetical protein
MFAFRLAIEMEGKMTTEKLKTAVREALYGIDVQSDWCLSTVDRITTALSRRGVVVEGEIDRLREIEVAARNVANTLKGGFIVCENCGEQEDTTGIDYARELYDALEDVPQTPPAPVSEGMYVRANRESIERFEAENKQPAPAFEVGKRYRARCGDIAVITEIREGFDYPLLGMLGDEDETWTYEGRAGMTNETPFDILPGAIPETPAPTPLTYVQACALPVGSEVVCLDVGGYVGNLIKVGEVYTISGNDSPFYDKSNASFKNKNGDGFVLHSGCCHLFAAAPPSATVAERGPHPVPCEQHERELLNVMRERDSAEESLGGAYRLVTGELPKWSNHFGYSSALNAIEEVILSLKETALPVSGESTAPGMSDEGIGGHLKLAWVKAPMNGANPWPHVARRARELLQPPATVPDGAFWARRAACLERELDEVKGRAERVRVEIERLLRNGGSSDFDLGYDECLSRIASFAGFTIHPRVPEQPLRVEIAK